MAVREAIVDGHELKQIPEMDWYKQCRPSAIIFERMFCFPVFPFLVMGGVHFTCTTKTNNFAI